MRPQRGQESVTLRQPSTDVPAPMNVIPSSLALSTSASREAPWSPRRARRIASRFLGVHHAFLRIALIASSNPQLQMAAGSWLRAFGHGPAGPVPTRCWP